MNSKEPVFSKDLANKTLTIVKVFEAPLPLVWTAFTDSEVLDLWWAPKPYQAVTKTMYFMEDGVWIYSMTGPAGDQSWCKVNFHKIVPKKSMSSSVLFCDENGVDHDDFPVMHWNQNFTVNEQRTTVTTEITFKTAADLEMIIDLGFQQGFTAALGNLDTYLASSALI